MGGVEKLILKLTSASTKVEVEARAELGNIIIEDQTLFLTCKLFRMNRS